MIGNKKVRRHIKRLKVGEIFKSDVYKDIVRVSAKDRGNIREGRVCTISVNDRRIYAIVRGLKGAPKGTILLDELTRDRLRINKGSSHSFTISEASVFGQIQWACSTAEAGPRIASIVAVWSLVLAILGMTLAVLPLGPTLVRIAGQHETESALVVAGIFVGFIIPAVVIPWFIKVASSLSRIAEGDDSSIPGWFTGWFERIFAFLLVLTVKFDAIPALLIAWVGAKLASNWHRSGQDERMKQYGYKWIRARSFIAIMAGTLSLGFAVVGGFLVLRGIKDSSFYQTLFPTLAPTSSQTS